MSIDWRHDRRHFLQTSLKLGAWACLAASLPSEATSQRASVVDFGADPTGIKDSTAAVRRAIASLAPANARLVFPSGKYLFSDHGAANSDAVMQFSGFDSVEVYANNAELHFSGPLPAFAFSSCMGVAVHDMKLDWSGGVAADKTIALAFEQCDGVLLEGIGVLRAPGTGLALTDCRDVHLEGIALAPGPDTRLALAGGGHAAVIKNCHGDVKLRGCSFEGVGGDGIHIYQSYWRIRERLDERSVVIEALGAHPLEQGQLPRPNDFVQFSSPESLALLGEIAVESASVNKQGATLKFAETLSPVILSGMLVCSVVDAPKVVIDHCRIGGNLGRGVVAHARTEITNCQFTGCGRAAILLSADVRRMEGPVVQNVNIRTNTFENCNQGSGSDTRGIITIDTAHEREHNEVPKFAVNSGIRIQNNVFKDASSAAIYAAGVIGMLVEGNTFGRTLHSAAQNHIPAALMLRNVADADVRGNISSTAQSIVMEQCTDTVLVEGNRMLTTEKS